MRGFSLIELLMVISLISLLLTSALPTYTTHVRHEERVEAEAALMQLALALEDYHLSHQTYIGVSLQQLQQPEWVAQHHYQLSMRFPGPHLYVLKATPINTTDDCGALTLTDTGERGISGSNQINDCW